MRFSLSSSLTLTFALGFGTIALAQSRPPDIAFTPRALDPGASETAAAGDMNNDGRLDIISGEFWYEAPAWTKHRFREIGYTNGYIDDFSDLAIDVNGDGYADVVSVSWFAKKMSWWKNPGRTRAAWIEIPIDSGFPIEFAFLVDIDNDGKAREILPQSGDEKAPLAWYELKPGGGAGGTGGAGEGAWIKHVVSPRSYGHGIGAGDVNGDGRTDILTPKGWLEAPADPRGTAEWTLHADWEEKAHLGFLHVVDINGDKRPDVLTSNGHDYGVFWLEQNASAADGKKFTKRVIDDAWSQAHASTVIDVNGDGRLDFVTGKRFMAHNGKDPGEREPLGVYWYEHRASAGAPGGVEWIRHLVDYGSRVGGGMQIPVVDLDGDGDLDLVTGGKSGLFLIRNDSKNTTPTSAAKTPAASRLR